MIDRPPLLVAPRRGDWTQYELSELNRIRAVCAEHAGFAQWECGHTDEGDPWCIVYLRGHGRIILHIARIDRCYVIVAPRQSLSSRSTSMRDAIEFALRELVRELPQVCRAG
jgi:hypothetical protein